MADEIPDFDLYAELEVSERASVETIQAAYRSLQLRNHPDRVGPDAGARAVRLNIARDWLTDPRRRLRYDARLAGARHHTDPASTDPAGDPRARERPDDETDAARAEDAGEDPNADGEPADEAEAGAEADGNEADVEHGDETDSALRATHILLRLDLARLVRLWIVGLAFLGGLALAAGVTTAAAERVAGTVVSLLVLLALTSRRVRTSPDAGLVVRAKRTWWSAIGWLGLGLLAMNGVSAVALSMGGAAGSRGALAASAVLGPVLAATTAMSLTALRRRSGPIRASVDDFLAMTPTQFETAVGEVLGRHGYRLRPTGGPGDLVADLVGTDSTGKSTVVQCKRYAPGHPVGSRDVQLLIAMGMRHHGAQRLVLVTTSDFTDPAIDLAEAHDVRLIDGEELEDLTR